VKFRYMATVIAASTVALISGCSATPQASSEASPSAASIASPASTATPSLAGPKSLMENFVGTWACTGGDYSMMHIQKTATLKIDEDYFWQAQWDTEHSATTWDAAGNTVASGRMNFSGTNLTLLFDSLGEVQGAKSSLNVSTMFFSYLTETIPKAPIVVSASIPGSNQTTKYSFAATDDSFTVDTATPSDRPLVCKRS
jgi:hypothetical protein